jgi:hypothetical protein
MPTNTSALASNVANALSPSATSSPIQSLLYSQFAYNNSNPLVQNPFATAKPYILPSQIPSSKIQSQINEVLNSESAKSKTAPYYVPKYLPSELVPYGYTGYNVLNEKGCYWVWQCPESYDSLYNDYVKSTSTSKTSTMEPPTYQTPMGLTTGPLPKT